MMTFFREDGPWHQSLRSLFGPSVADGIRNAMVAQLASGAGPRVVARLLERQFGVGLTWALRMSRTSMLYARRYATQATYQANSHVVRGWQWHAHLDDRVCMSCVAQHGSYHSTSEVLNDHHNGRCAMIPVTLPWTALGVRGVPDMEPVGAGLDWFDGLSAARQQQLMGPSMWEAWRAGDVRWDQLSRTYIDPLYGEMRRAATLTELVGPQAAAAYRSAK